MSQVVTDLIYNAGMLIALTVIYDSLPLRRYNHPRKLWFQIVTGVLLSLTAVVILSRPWQIVPGFRIDARSVLLSISGLFFGLVPTLLVTITALIYRIALGGAGVPAGIGLIVTSSVLGLIWRYARQRYLTKFKFWELYVFGFLVHVAMLIWVYTLPGPYNIEILKRITLPVMILYPVVTVFLGQLLARQTVQYKTQTTLQLNEAHYRRIVETATEGIWASDRNGITTFVNHALSTITGYTEEEMIGKPMVNFINFDATSRTKPHRRRPGFFQAQSMESTYRRKDGRIVWMRVSISPLYNDEGRISGGLAMVNDITAQKEAEQELRESEQLFKSIFDQSATGVVQVDPAGNYLQVNARMCEIVGYSREELLTMTYKQITYPDDLVIDQNALESALNGAGDTFVLEKRYIHKQGHAVWVRLHCTLVFNEKREYQWATVIIVDITEERRAEAERRRQQELLQSIVDTIPVMIIMTDPAGKFILANRAHQLSTGWDIGEFSHEDDYIRAAYPEISLREKVTDEIEASDQIWRDHITQKKDGGVIHTSWANVALSDGTRIGFGMDVTERYTMESALRASEQLFKSIFEQSAVGTAQVNARAEILQANTRLSEIVGFSHEELLSMTYIDLTHPDDRERTLARIANIKETQQTNFVFETRCIHKQGHPVWVELHGNVVRDEDGNHVYSVVMIVDITERYLVEQERRRQQEFLQTIVDNIPVMIVMSDQTRNYLMVNQAYEDIMGWDMRSHPRTIEMLAASYPDPEQRHKVEQVIAQADAVWHDFETKTGHGTTIHTSWANVSLSDGRRIGFGMDITDRKQAEMELQAQKELLQSIIDHLPVCVNLSDPEGNYVFLNRAFHDLLGWTIDETPTIETMLTKANLSPVEREQTNSRIQHSKGIWQDSISRTRDGREIPMSWIDLRLPDGRHLGIGQDITERHKAELVMKEQQALLQTIIDYLPVALNITDKHGNYTFINRAHSQILGWDLDELKTVDNMVQLVYPDPEYSRYVRRSISSSTGTWQDFTVHSRDGRDIPMSWIDVRLPDGNHLGIGQDITERKLVERQIRQINTELELRVAQRTEELESRNRELQTFTYSASHDLKAPLRGIDGYSRLLEMQYMSQLDTEGQHFITQIRRATELMGRLIEDLLAYSRMEQQPLLIREIDLSQWLEALLEELKPQIELSKAQLVLTVENITIHADPEGLRTAMRNLIDNALKFSADVTQPRIEIGGFSDDTCHKIWVKDNGIGFDMQFHDRIFGIFQRLHRAEDYPGTGVGLAIVQRAMHRMGGRAWAQSEPGKGATFYLEIPVKSHDDVYNT